MLLLGFLRLMGQVFRRKITLRQAILTVKMRVSNNMKELNDDFDWGQYHSYYREELKSISRIHTLNPKASEMSFVDGKLWVSEKIKPLHPNHYLLYEVISSLRPTSILEAGFGGGDHLSNLSLLLPQSALHGVDRSDGQLKTLRDRHPNLNAHLQILDLTSASSQLPKVDLVYSQAVLMHISETGGRFDGALKNIFEAAKCYVVLMENWTEHNFFNHVESALAQNPEWEGARLYYVVHPVEEGVRALVASKIALPYAELVDYSQLLQGQHLKPH